MICSIFSGVMQSHLHAKKTRRGIPNFCHRTVQFLSPVNFQRVNAALLIIVRHGVPHFSDVQIKEKLSTGGSLYTSKPKALCEKCVRVNRTCHSLSVSNSSPMVRVAITKWRTQFKKVSRRLSLQKKVLKTSQITDLLFLRG